MAGVTQWRNDPDRPFRSIRRHRHGSRSNNRKRLDGSKPNSAGPMSPRRGANLPWRWPTDDPIRHLHQRREIVSASRPNLGHERRHGKGVPIRCSASGRGHRAWEMRKRRNTDQEPNRARTATPLSGRPRPGALLCHRHAYTASSSWTGTIYADGWARWVERGHVHIGYVQTCPYCD